MTIWIWTGGRPSNSAKALSALDGFKRMITGKGVKPKDIVVNWGSTKGPMIFDATYPKKWLNGADAVGIAANKRTTFQVLSGAPEINTVPWTANQAVANEWQAEGSTVVIRKTLTGHSGNGILIVEEKADVIENAPLYTKYIYKTKEFRVHATVDKVFDTQQKVRDPEVEVKSWKIRSHENGFIFTRNNVVPDPDRDALACKTVDSLGLTFGAVDIVQDKKGKYYVLEVNTAPGLEGKSVASYETAIREIANAA